MDKITAYTMHTRRGGVNLLISVTAESHRAAIGLLRAAGHVIPGPEQVRPTTILPGHGHAFLADWPEHFLELESKIPAPESNPGDPSR